MSIQLYQGDCLEIMKNIPGGSVDMVLCDLPFGLGKRARKRFLERKPKAHEGARDDSNLLSVAAYIQQTKNEWQSIQGTQWRAQVRKLGEIQNRV